MDKLTLTDFEDDVLVAEPFGFTLATGRFYIGIAKHDLGAVTSVVLDQYQVADLAIQLTTWLEEVSEF